MKLLAVLVLLLALAPRPMLAAIDNTSLLAAVREARGDSIPTHPALTEVAARRVVEIQTNFSHEGAGGLPWTSGELLVTNTFSDDIAASSAVAGMLASPEHRDVLLGSWTHVGVAVSEIGDQNWFVVILATVVAPTLPPTDTR